MKLKLYSILFLALIQLASATTLHGTVYDISLDVVQNAVITIEGVQKQVIVAKTGIYSVELPIGNYTFTVQKGNETLLHEDILITADGDFNIDLVALQLLDEFDEALADEIENVTAAIEEEPPARNYLLISLLLLAIIITTYFFFKHAKPLEGKKAQKKQERKQELSAELPEDLQPIIEFVKKQDGRTTQKEICKAFPFSEAKISLMLADLEARGLVQKIKKGRGNIILLK